MQKFNEPVKNVEIFLILINLLKFNFFLKKSTQKSKNEPKLD